MQMCYKHIGLCNLHNRLHVHTLSPYIEPELPPRSARLKDAHVAASDNCLHSSERVRVALSNAQLKMSC